MNKVLWNENKMSVGIELIDNQHKKLLNIINKLEDSITTNTQKKDSLSIVNEIIDYTMYHFKTEEDLFDKYNYEKKDEHKKEHNSLIKKILNVKDILTDDRLKRNEDYIEIVEEIYIFVIDWFLNHILQRDREYIELFERNGVK